MKLLLGVVGPFFVDVILDDSFRGREDNSESMGSTFVNCQEFLQWQIGSYKGSNG